MILMQINIYICPVKSCSVSAFLSVVCTEYVTKCVFYDDSKCLMIVAVNWSESVKFAN